MKPGIHSIGATEYHADPAGRPSLSASIAKILCTASPRHAWTAHPRLNPDYMPDADPKYDVGTACHALILEGKNAVQVIDFPDWRTNAAKEQRDEARAAGLVPLLAKDWLIVEEMVAAVRTELAAHKADPPLFQDGKPEQTIVWEEDGVLCRGLLDWFRDDRTAIDDLKTTSRSANPDAYSRNLFGVGGDVQAAFYLRGVLALTGVMPAFRWVVVETSPPYALSVVSPGPDVLALGEAKVERAIAIWRECLARDEWPGYPQEVCYAGMPAWEESRWLERWEEVA